MSANWKYRQSLIKNADSIIKNDQVSQCSDVPLFPKTTNSTNTPYLYTSCVDQAKPIGYESSDLKNIYLERQRLKCTMIAPEL